MTILDLVLLPLTTVHHFVHRLWFAFLSLWTRTDHFAPHSNAGFEGYYARTHLENGGTLAIVFCWVKNAKDRPNLVHVSYTPPGH